MIPPADVPLLTEFMKNFASIRPTATAILMGAVIFAFAPGVRPLLRAQTGQTGQTATQSLLDKAHALEVRGRMDMAAQTWQQVLLADPEALEDDVLESCLYILRDRLFRAQQAKPSEAG